MSGIVDNVQRNRFELTEDGKLAFAEYQVREGVMVIPHVEADPALRGKGAAGRLMTGVMDEARQRGLKVQPVCGYAAAFIRRDAKYHDLLPDRFCTSPR